MCTLDCVAGTLGSAQRSLPESRPRLLRWRLSSLFQVLLCGGRAYRRPRPRDRPTLRPARAANGKLRVARPACRGRSAATRCLQAREGSVRPGGGDGVLQAPGRWRLHAARPPCLPGWTSHGAANWLGDMAGRPFALALCGTLLPGNRRLGTGVCDVIVQADQ